jgi:hypothetical protein
MSTIQGEVPNADMADTRFILFEIRVPYNDYLATLSPNLAMVARASTYGPLTTKPDARNARWPQCVLSIVDMKKDWKHIFAFEP